MVFINVIQRNPIVLECHKGSEEGESFRLVIDPITKDVIEKPEDPDIDASAAYSRVYSFLVEGKPIPDKIDAEWG